MKIVIPVSCFEFNKPLNVLGFIKSLRHFGPYKKHELLLIVRPSEYIFGKQVYDLISDLFGKSVFHKLKTDGEFGWPLGPNSYWKQTIDYFIEIDNKDPWFWMELDTIPLKPKWADSLEAEYKKCKKECLGTVNNTAITTNDFYRVNIAQHLQGTAVYPPRIDEICSIWKFVDQIPKAFDVITQWEVMPHVADTKLIRQGFRTINYKLNMFPFFIKGQDNGDLQGGESFDQIVPKETVLLHGVKDTSLADIVISDDYSLYLESAKKDKMPSSLECKNFQKRKIPVFYHVPRSYGTYVGLYILKQAGDYFGQSDLVGEEPDEFRFLNNWTIKMSKFSEIKIKCAVTNRFFTDHLLNLKSFSEYEGRNYYLEASDLSEFVISNLMVFSLEVSGFGEQKTIEMLSIFEKFYEFSKSITLRDPLERIFSLYSYLKSSSSSHEVTHGVYDGLESFEEFADSDMVDSDWVCRNLLSLGEDDVLPKDVLEKVSKELENFCFYKVSQLDKDIFTHLKSCYPLYNFPNRDKYVLDFNSSNSSKDYSEDCGKKISLINMVDNFIFENFGKSLG